MFYWDRWRLARRGPLPRLIKATSYSRLRAHCGRDARDPSDSSQVLSHEGRDLPGVDCFPGHVAIV